MRLGSLLGAPLPEAYRKPSFAIPNRRIIESGGSSREAPGWLLGRLLGMLLEDNVWHTQFEVFAYGWGGVGAHGSGRAGSHMFADTTKEPLRCNNLIHPASNFGTIYFDIVLILLDV